MKRDPLTHMGPPFGDMRQYASVRQMEFVDGPERGQRALMFSTGAGLDFMVLPDRSLDIGTLHHNGRQLAWMSPGGLVAPQYLQAESDGGFGFGRGFCGFLVTCGLTHIGAPGYGEPQHGRLPYSPARLTAYGEDFEAEVPMLYCEGDIRQVRYGAETLVLRRRIEAPVGQKLLRIHDRISNLGPGASPLELMYHFNLGNAAVNNTSRMELNARNCMDRLEAVEDHLPKAAIQLPCTDRSNAEFSIHSSDHKIAFSWASAQLPCLQFWRDLRPNVGVFSVEPRNFSPDRAPPELNPGESMDFGVTLLFETANP